MSNEGIKSLKKKIKVAFIYGSIAKKEDRANSDIDLLIISDTLTYRDIFQLLTKTEEQLGRKINPSIYTTSDWVKKIKQENNFIDQIKKQPKIFLVGSKEQLDEFSYLVKANH